jgi:hypothetical protein
MNNPCTSVIGEKPYPFTKPLWWPIDINCTAKGGLRFYFFLPFGLCLQTSFFLEVEDVVLWQRWGLILTRPETAEEEELRIEAWQEAAFMEKEANRYTEWAY